ncbi:actin depolymerizing protein [Dendrothele bispora CBS 962.96]|uniref:Actin depolymerizing protein n=1 Tax=Dendrothele bispora (strain CBS 962.96) TaxID=1314807 RepID=A0A4S8MXT1_DENBC|nr:actin depolymerizing protein [Dendrothele bispora CBS 962.96]
MSASSGISVSPELTSTFSTAVDSQSTRFLKISIRNESLVHDTSVLVQGSFDSDLSKLQDILEDNVPAYVLAKTDSPNEWLAIYYVPDSAKVREKMLYASTRSSLLKSLGSTLFNDSMFATSKDDLTPEAYKAHLAHLAAPKPLSAREKELEDIKAAERESGTNTPYEGARRTASPLVTGHGLNWSEEVEQAVKSLGEEEEEKVLVVTIDVPTETLTVSKLTPVSANTLKTALPSSEPCYAFFAWNHSYTNPPKRELVFIYSCPSTSPVKHRMIYSSGAALVTQGLKTILSSSSTISVASRRAETSDPSEVNEEFLKDGLGYDSASSGATGIGGIEPRAPLPSDEKKAFAKPRGPVRRRP